MHSYSLGKCKVGGGYATPKKGVISSGRGLVDLKCQEGMPKTDKEEKIRGYRRKGNPWGGGGVVDANCYCKGGGVMLDTGKADKI